jgi:hypothetical protein
MPQFDALASWRTDLREGRGTPQRALPVRVPQIDVQGG